MMQNLKLFTPVASLKMSVRLGNLWLRISSLSVQLPDTYGGMGEYNNQHF
jgi:hypothetical protein